MRTMRRDDKNHRKAEDTEFRADVGFPSAETST